MHACTNTHARMHTPAAARREEACEAPRRRRHRCLPAPGAYWSLQRPTQRAATARRQQRGQRRSLMARQLTKPTAIRHCRRRWRSRSHRQRSVPSGARPGMPPPLGQPRYCPRGARLRLRPQRGRCPAACAAHAQGCAGARACTRCALGMHE
eukprot:142331-Chlamydomonas_euryale.AAC.1